MLTGVETAGIVLAAFPVIVQLIEGYKEGCKPLDSWLRFRKTFLSLVQDIRLQETKLESNVRRLLLPLVESDGELQMPLAEPGGPAWFDYELEEALQRRLLNSYESYIDTVGRIQDTLNEFQRQLGISDGVKDEVLNHLQQKSPAAIKALQSSRKIDWKYEWNRIKISWAREDLKRLIEKLDRLNGHLRTLLSDGEKLNIVKQSRITPRSRSIQQLRGHAITLCNFLAKQ